MDKIILLLPIVMLAFWAFALGSSGNKKKGKKDKVINLDWKGDCSDFSSDYKRCSSQCGFCKSIQNDIDILHSKQRIRIKETIRNLQV